MPVICNTPAQDLLTINEMREYLASSCLPADLRRRASNCYEFRDLSMAENVSYFHGCQYTLLDLFSWTELKAYSEELILPDDFRARMEKVIDDSCINCDGRKCMDCVLRYYDHTCTHDCPNCC